MMESHEEVDEMSGTGEVGGEGGGEGRRERVGGENLVERFLDEMG